ncbi:MAG: ATP-binding protein [Thermodesulfovibrionales bacterium]
MRPFESLTEYFHHKSKIFLIAFNIVLLLAIGLIDYVTGYEIGISLFYLIPISFAAWFGGRTPSIIISSLSVLTIAVTDIMAGKDFPHYFIEIWNLLMHLGFFTVYAVVICIVKADLDKRRILIEELQNALGEVKQLSAEVEQKAQELIRSNKELEQFAYIAAHDLKGPLLVVESYIFKLQNRYQNIFDQDAKRYVGEAIDGIDRMKLLITDLLSYAKAGAQTNDRELIDCNKALQHALANLEVEIEERNASITGDKLPLVIAIDTQIVQLFQNLISNSIKFCREGNPRIHVSAEDKDNAWLFSVRDNGIGIAPENTVRIFEIFKRFHGGSEYSGSGIGLAICKKIIDGHAGHIWVESELGKGATFYFTVPKKIN